MPRLRSASSTSSLENRSVASSPLPSPTVRISCAALSWSMFGSFTSVSNGGQHGNYRPHQPDPAPLPNRPPACQPKARRWRRGGGIACAHRERPEVLVTLLRRHAVILRYQLDLNKMRSQL